MPRLKFGIDLNNGVRDTGKEGWVDGDYVGLVIQTVEGRHAQT
jgi:hypothetical protein